MFVIRAPRLLLGGLFGLAACQTPTAPEPSKAPEARPAAAATATVTAPASRPAPTSRPAPAAPAGFDHTHAAFDALLRRFVKDGAVDYSGLTRDGRAELTAYLGALGAVTSFDGWSEPQRLAFWINAYNAWTLELILRSWPVKSIRDLHPPDGPWKHPLVELAVPDAPRTLDALEHAVIRKRFAEPRIHFAVVCASIGCPPLRSEAFVPARLDDQLEAQTRRFIQDASKNRLDARAKTLRLSRVFEWFAGDFGAGPQDVIAFVVARMGPEAQSLAKAGGLEIAYLEYDWNLNGR